jgi:hypothetical protein
MKLNDLIQRLQDIVDETPDAGEAEVLIATQRSWPLAHRVDALTLDCVEADKPVLWIADGSHPHDRSPYAPKHAWNGEQVFADPEDDEDMERA